MTNRFAEHTFTELAKAGIAFLVMGIGLYVMWAKIEEYDTANTANTKRLQRELLLLKKEAAECTSEYQRVLLDQLNKTTLVIERNTFALETLTKR